MRLKTMLLAYSNRRILTKTELVSVYRSVEKLVRTCQELEDSFLKLRKLALYHRRKLRYSVKEKMPRRAMPKTPVRNRLRADLPRFMAHVERDRTQVLMAIQVTKKLRARIAWLRAKKHKHTEALTEMKRRRGMKYRYRGVKEKELR